MVTGTLSICQEKEGSHSRSVVWVVFPTVEAWANLLVHIPQASSLPPSRKLTLNVWCRGGLLRKREASDLNVLKKRESWVRQLKTDRQRPIGSR